MKRLFLFATVAVSLVACNTKSLSVETVVPETPEHLRTFLAVAPQDTKTTIDELSVKWASSDKIKVYGCTGGAYVASAVYKVKSGAGETTAVFELDEGESLVECDAYYAVYPSTLDINTSSLPGSIAVNTALNLTNQSIPVGASYDPNYAIMTAHTDGEGKLAFSHGVTYVKVTLPDIDGITGIEVSFGRNALATKPSYTSSTGAINGQSGNTDKVKATGTFTPEASYFLPVPPRHTGTKYDSKPSTVRVTLYKGESDSYLETDALKNDKYVLYEGKVWDLGAPPINFAPVIAPVAPSKIEYNAGTGSFTFTIKNPVDAVNPSVSVTSGGTWLALDDPEITVSGDIYTVHFICSDNDDVNAEERSGEITISYTGATSRPITITQKIQSVAATESYSWNFNDYDLATLSGYSSGTSFTANTDITFTYDTNKTLVYHSGNQAKSKWGTGTPSGSTRNYITFGGGGSESQRFFEFTTQNEGTITIEAYNSNSTNRNAIAKSSGSNDSATTYTSNSISKTNTNITELTISDVPAGTIKVYTSGDMYFYSISFSSN